MYPNPYMFQGINPQFQQPSFQQPGFQQFQSQQVPVVDGEESISQLTLSPNSSTFLLKKDGRTGWLCTSDGLGTVTRFQFSRDLPEEPTPGITERLERVERMIANIETLIKEMGVQINAKSGGSYRPKQDDRDGRKPKADQTDH